MKAITTKPLSSNAKGITAAETKISSATNGVKKQAKSIKLEIDSDLNIIKITYEIHYFDNKGNPLNITPKKETEIIRDFPETGEVEIGEDGLEVEGSYKKLTDENLSITNWNAQLGPIVIGSAIAHVEKIENIK